MNLPFPTYICSYSLSMKVTEDEGVPVCEETWLVMEYRLVFGVFTNIAQFVLPFTTIFLCYVRISFKIKQRQSSSIQRFRSEEYCHSSSIF